MVRLILLCLAVGTLTNSRSMDNNAPTYIKERKFEGYIFPKEYVLDIPAENIKSRYTPSKEDIIKAENIIEEQIYYINKSLINQTGGCPIIHKNLNKYKRQYFGFINDKGESIIWINLIWKKEITASWGQEVVIILDGCSHYWNIKINLISNKAFDLQVNGLS